MNARLFEKIEASKPWTDRYANDRANPSKLIKRIASRNAGEGITRATLFEIAKVKSPRRAKDTEKNKEAAVVSITAVAFDRARIIDEETRISLLTSLHGVRVPTASAILSWTHPDIWPVIDRRTWSALVEMGLVAEGPGTRLTPKHWVQYLDIILPTASKLRWTPQEVDRWLYGFARDNKLGQTP